jgi:hypothetical protein
LGVYGERNYGERNYGEGNYGEGNYGEGHYGEDNERRKKKPGYKEGNELRRGWEIKDAAGRNEKCGRENPHSNQPSP